MISSLPSQCHSVHFQTQSAIKCLHRKFKIFYLFFLSLFKSRLFLVLILLLVCVAWNPFDLFTLLIKHRNSDIRPSYICVNHSELSTLSNAWPNLNIQCLDSPKWNKALSRARTNEASLHAWKCEQSTWTNLFGVFIWHQYIWRYIFLVSSWINDADQISVSRIWQFNYFNVFSNEIINLKAIEGTKKAIKYYTTVENRYSLLATIVIITEQLLN